MTTRKPGPHDPTATRTADQSTQTAGGLHQGLEGVRPGPGPEVAREAEAKDVLDRSDVDDVLNRNEEGLYETPRRYEEAEEDDSTMPSRKSSLNTKI